jgi:hypothetical protein
MLSARTGAKLRVIADQIKLLQQEARKVLADAKEEQTLTRARCAFKRIPGRTYHLYRKSDGEPFFSMLAPAEWGGEVPYAFLGSYRLETDYSWTPADRADRPDDTASWSHNCCASAAWHREARDEDIPLDRRRGGGARHRRHGCLRLRGAERRDPRVCRGG